MKSRDLIKRLAAFGLDEREAMVYYHLSRLGPVRAAEVANASGVKRTEVYRVMDALEAKGLIEKTLERPRRFVPIAIDDALDRSLETRERELDELRHERDVLAAEWPSQTAEPAGPGERFAVHHGRSQIRGLLTRMVESAKEEIILVTLKRGLSRLDTMGVLDAVLKKAASGCVVQILTEVAPSNLATVEPLAAPCEVRHGTLPGYHQVVIVDGREIALFVSVDPLVSTHEAGETVLWLTAPDFILAQKSLFDTLWEDGLSIESRVQELETERVAETVSLVRGRWARYDRMKGMLYRARKDVLIVLGTADAARLDRAGVAALLARVAAKGVRVRLVSDGAPAEALAGVETRVTKRPPPTALMFVDGDEMLVSVGTEAAPDAVAHDDEWSTWCTVRDTVARARALAESLWDDAS